ncbi:MAG: hypothetical protein QXF28_00355 [Nitrososphaerota archaeon]
MEKDRLIAKLTEDLNLCEGYLKKEARLDLVLRILEELMNEIEEAKKENMPMYDIEERVRILYHRASALVTLNGEKARK